jgi:hypothetical protein
MAGQLAAAMAMAGRGFRVFPLRPFGKKPAVDDFPSVATTDETTLRAWWTQQPDYNIGILTTDMVVVDIDVKNRADAVDQYVQAGGHWDTLVVQTPTGGYHAYFDGPDSKLVANLLPGVDIRSHNGYVVGPGSYTDAEASGDTQVKATGYYHIVADKPLPWVPGGIEVKLEAPGRRTRQDTGVDLDTESAVANAAVWLQDAPPAVEGLGGDNTTYRTAAKLVRDYGLTEWTAYELMLAHWNERCQPPWPADQLWAKVQNAGSYGTGDLGSARPEATFGTVQVIKSPLQLTGRERGVYMGNLLDADALRPRPWLVDRMLMRRDVTVLAATGAAGKSAVTLTMLCHFAVGLGYGPYMLKEPGVPLRSLIYNAEDDREEQTRRVLAICHAFVLDYRQVRENLAFMDDAEGELLLAAAGQGAIAANEAAINYVIETAKSERADIIVLDPLVNLHTCNENDNGHMRFVIGILRRIARLSNTAMFTPHHTSKGGANGARDDADGIRGAGAIVNSARIALRLSSPTDDDRKEYGIKDDEKHSFVRIDDAKANMYLKSSGAAMWCRWHSIKLMTGDMLGVPMPVKINDKVEAQRIFIAQTLHGHMLAQGTGSMIRAEAVRVVAAADNLYEKMNAQTLRRLIENVLSVPVPLGADRIVCGTDEKGDTLIKLM